VIHLLLFDVDGVLVDARGYLKALQDTVAHFSRKMGAGDHPPTEEEVRTFEANGLTSEWDSGAACVGVLLVERLRRAPVSGLPARWSEALAFLDAHPGPLPHPDYGAWARRIGARLGEGTTPAGAARATLREEGRDVAALEALLKTLLGHTHDFHRSPVTRHFQHLAVGSRTVAETYAVAPDFESPAYLRQHDRPLLSSAARGRLEESAARGGVRVALYTARPSLPPVEAKETSTGDPPEAEMARALAGFDGWPLIGMGRMRWLARQSGDPVERLVKPSPAQALAAMGAAWSGREAAALEAALALYRDGDLRPPLSDLGGVRVHVFEDTPGGLEAVGRAVEALRGAGQAVDWRAYGIAPAGGAKAAALAARGAPVYPSINEALDAALNQVRSRSHTFEQEAS
jgi:phosphoglycolate phosphatase-like HAD superfamily hydrolase